DIEHETGADLARTHISDQLDRREPERLGEAGSHELDRRSEHQVGQAATGEQVARDTRPDDVADPHQLGGCLREDGGPGVKAERLARNVRPEREPGLQKLVHEPDAEGLKHRSEEHTSELQSRFDLVCRLLLEKKKKQSKYRYSESQLYNLLRQSP